MHEKSEKHESEDRFSVLLFVIINTLFLGIIYTSVALSAPDMWKQEMRSGWVSLVITFLVVHLATAFFEFFFHRYVLHAPAIPFLAYFYKQHTHHHALTSVRPPRMEKGVHNEFPILEEHQHEASFFPWYSLLVFAGLATPIFAVVHYFLPQTPIFLAGYAALTWSLVLYEILHAFEHKSVESWTPLLKHPTYGVFWRMVYGFHLRHHASIHSNESISGWFGIPIPDFVFGTWVNPKTLYEHGRKDVALVEFEPPKPVWYIRLLDQYVDESVQRRREKSRS